MDDRTVQLLDSVIKIAEMTLGDGEYKRGAIETLTGLRDALTSSSSSSSSSASEETVDSTETKSKKDETYAEWLYAR